MMSEPPRMEDARFLAGEGNYVGNLFVPGMLHMKILRSPHAHAAIRSIDVDRAASLRGVVAVHTGPELRDELKPMPSANIPGLHVPHRLALALDRVHLVGEPVA